MNFHEHSLQIVNVVYIHWFAYYTVNVFNLLQFIPLIIVITATVNKLQKYIYLHITFKIAYGDNKFLS
jgi:hypothetical protein